MSTIASTPTTTSTFWPLVYRFAWKEVRKMRGFAIGVAGLAVLLMIFCLYLHYSEPTVGIDNARAAMLLLGAFGGGAFVAIGAATTAFAVEREEQTDTFLLTLPRYWQALFAGKLLGVCFLALTFSLGMGMVAWILGGFGFPSKGGLPLYLHLGMVLLAEATVWGLVVSLLVRRPLLAAVLACAATSFSSQIAIAIANEEGYQAQAFADALNYRWLLCGVGLATAMLLARRWVNRTESTRTQRRDRRWQFTDVIPAALQRSMAASAITNLLPVGPTTSRSIFWRLVWQTWRESWQIMLGVVGVGLLLMWAVEGLRELSQDGRSMPSPAALMSTFFIPGLCGALVFRQDHRRGQHQFLTEHAGRPRLVWFARIFTWGTYLTVLVLLIVGLAAWVLVSWLGFQEPTVSHSPWANIHMAERQMFWSDFFYLGVPTAIFATFLAFSLGQLASLLLKSEILAAGLSLFASIGVMLYCQLIWTWRLPPVWCLLPIALGALAATYLRIGDWLAARSTRASWSRVAAAAIVPMLVVVASLPMIRHAQIEWALNQLAIGDAMLRQGVNAKTASIDVVAARRQLEQAFDAQVADFEERHREAAEVVREHQKALQEILEKVPMDSFDMEERAAEELSIPDAVRSQVDKIDRLPQPEVERLVKLAKQPGTLTHQDLHSVAAIVAILQADAWKWIKSGDLDVAWSRIQAIELLRNRWRPVKSRDLPIDRENLLNHWALALGQTPGRIRAATASLAEASDDGPLPEDAVIPYYLAAREFLNDGTTSHANIYLPTPSSVALMLDQFPGEHHRAEQALRVFAIISLQHAANAAHQQTIIQSRTQSLPSLQDPLQHDLLSDIAYGHPMWKTASSSLLAEEIWRTISRTDLDLSSDRNELTRQRLSQLRLLLIAHHLQHGEYPLSLDELAVDNSVDLLATVMTDPTSGGQFQYAPRYFEQMTWGKGLWEQFQRERDIAAPMIWSAGSGLAAKTQVQVPPHLIPADAVVGQPARRFVMEFPGVNSYFAEVDDGLRILQGLVLLDVLPNENQYPNSNPPTPESESTAPESD